MSERIGSFATKVTGILPRGLKQEERRIASELIDMLDVM